MDNEKRPAEAPGMSAQQISQCWKAYEKSQIKPESSEYTIFECGWGAARASVSLPQAPAEAPAATEGPGAPPLPTLEQWMLQQYPGANLDNLEIPARITIQIAKSYHNALASAVPGAGSAAQKKMWTPWFIGDLRRSLFLEVDCAWNGVVRDVTAKHEREGGVVGEEAVFKELAEYLRNQAGASSEGAAGVSLPAALADDPNRCAVCGWTLAAKMEEGCTRGNCSLRPLPWRLYAPMRAQAEYGGRLDMSRFENAEERAK